MANKQVKPFNLSKMGTQVGMCLRNVRIAFDIAPKYNSAKDAMLASKKAGTLHDISTLPKDVAVPVFVDTTSDYEHVVTVDHGKWYSDGKLVTNPEKFKCFGWSETLNDVRVVEIVPDPAPSGLKVGDKVVLKSWIDYTNHVLRKTRDYYFINKIEANDRTIITADSVNGPVYAAVNMKNLIAYAPAPAPVAGFKVGDRVVPTNFVDYTGRPLKNQGRVYTISQLINDRAVLQYNGTTFAAMNTKNLRKA